ncbi:MAG: hypothetical protein AAFU85_26510 [Planctomycetota bacterium]
MKPFRWNLAKREQLGRLRRVDRNKSSVAYPQFDHDLRQCAARVLAFAGDSDLVFVGRSPESIFDYLSGILLETTWQDRLRLANISIRCCTSARIADSYPRAIAAAQKHFGEIQLLPRDLVTSPRPIALIDLVASGSTFQQIARLLFAWAHEDGIDLRAMTEKLRFVGITWRTKTSPMTYRWHQHVDWLSEFGSRSVKNVSVPGRFWDYVGNRQEKVSWSNPPARWSDPNIMRPPRQHSHQVALEFATKVFDNAVTSEERCSFADVLRKQPQMKESWFRDVVRMIRRR